MYRIPITIHNRLCRGEIPVVYAVIKTPFGDRAFAEKELEAIFETLARLADGTYLADGSELAGSDTVGIIEKSARVLNFGSFERTIQPQKDDVLSAYSGKQLQHISIELDNSDVYFSRLIAQEPFLGRQINIYVGFESEPQSTHLSIFKGIVSELSAMPVMTIEADER